jgi:hypothetical protein
MWEVARAAVAILTCIAAVGAWVLAWLYWRDSRASRRR